MSGVTVIIPAYGPTPHLRAILSRLEEQTIKPETVIVSHSGDEDPTEWIIRDFSNVTALHSEQRLFAGAARNRGAALAKSTFLAFCDSDVLPSRDWLERLLKAIDAAHPRLIVGSVGTARTGGYWGMSNWLCEFSEQAPWRPAGPQTGGASCNMLVRREDFEAIDGFPSQWRAGEDTLFFKLMRDRGLIQYLEPRAEVGHFNNEGFAAFRRHQFRIGKHFAGLRKAVRMRGSAMVAFPPLAIGLFLPKTLVVVRRILQDREKGLAHALRYGPGILIGALIFTSGAIAELFTRRRIGQ